MPVSDKQSHNFIFCEFGSGQTKDCSILPSGLAHFSQKCKFLATMCFRHSVPDYQHKCANVGTFTVCWQGESWNTHFFQFLPLWTLDNAMSTCIPTSFTPESNCTFITAHAQKFIFSRLRLLTTPEVFR